jgi:hypothetical protein
MSACSRSLGRVLSKSIERACSDTGAYLPLGFRRARFAETSSTLVRNGPRRIDELYRPPGVRVPQSLLTPRALRGAPLPVKPPEDLPKRAKYQPGEAGFDLSTAELARCYGRASRPCASGAVSIDTAAENT